MTKQQIKAAACRRLALQSVHAEDREIWFARELVRARALRTLMSRMAVVTRIFETAHPRPNALTQQRTRCRTHLPTRVAIGEIGQNAASAGDRMRAVRQ